MKKERIIDFRYAPDKSQCCIGLVDDKYKTLIWDDGSLVFDYSKSNDPDYYPLMQTPVLSRVVQNRGFTYRFKPEILHRDELVKREQTYGDPSVAVVTTTEYYKDSTFTWKSFAWKPDENTRIDVILYSLKGLESFKKTRAGVALHVLGEEFDIVSTGIETEDGDTLFLDKNKTFEGAYFIVQSGSFGDRKATVATAKEALSWCENYWKGIKPFVNTIQIPDSDLMDMIKSCGRNLLQAREIHDNVPTFQVGPTCYRGMWVADGLFMLDAIHIMGYREEAYAGLYALLRRVHPDGSIYAIPFHDKETAISLYTIIRQCELMNDIDRLKELWNTVLRGFEYIKRRVLSSDEYDDSQPLKGLYPLSYGDGGTNGLEPEYTTPLWTMSSLKKCIETAEKYDLSGKEEMQELLDKMMKRYKETIERDRRFTEDGLPYVPTSLLTEEEFAERVENFEKYFIDGEVCNWGGYNALTGTWTLAQVITPGELFPPNDPIVTEFANLLESLDKKQGIPEGSGWMSDGTVWGYEAMFYGQVMLYAGRANKAMDYIYGFANHAAPSRVWREEQALTGTNHSGIWGDMPHNWGSAEFLRLIRNMIVFEKCDELYILEGLFEEWLPTENCDLVLEKTPTKYGTISLNMKKQSEKNYSIDLEFNLFDYPKEIKVRVPSGFKIGNQTDGYVIINNEDKKVNLIMERI